VIVGGDNAVQALASVDGDVEVAVGRGLYLLSPETQTTVDGESLGARRPLERATKRTLDLLVSIPLAIVAAIAVPLIALAVRLDSSGPVLFRQMRVGRGGKLIEVYKFRSMHVDAEQRLASDPELRQQYLDNGHKLPEGTDPRITRVGRILRKTSIDELPQIFCVLRGTMSAIGPRPVLADELPVLYGDLQAHYCAVKPGITGLWQVSGRSNVTDRQRAELDTRYVDEWSPWLDIKILFKTIPAVLQGDGAH